MYVTSRGAPRTGLPFVLPVSFDKIDNNNNNNNNNKLTVEKVMSHQILMKNEGLKNILTCYCYLILCSVGVTFNM